MRFYDGCHWNLYKNTQIQFVLLTSTTFTTISTRSENYKYSCQNQTLFIFKVSFDFGIRKTASLNIDFVKNINLNQRVTCRA